MNITSRPSAIVYTSNTGYTREYAYILGEKMSLGVYSLDEAKDSLVEGTPIVYLGWLMAGFIKGYKTANRKFRIVAVCGVCMGDTGSQLEDVRRNNSIPEMLPTFTLQGGFDMNRLSGIYKSMMKTMSKILRRRINEKLEKTPSDEVILEMLDNGANYVREENLSSILAWYFSED